MPARPSWFPFRRARPTPPPVAADVRPGEPPPPPPPPGSDVERPPTVAELRRERRTLARRREIEIRDVGGLTVEMVRRDHFSSELLVERATDVLAVEQRIHELDALLAAEAAVRGLREVAYCKCGAPLPPGVHFCAHCGRPATTAPAERTCAHCGQSLPAEANFCVFCGHPVAAEELEEEQAESAGATMVRPAPEAAEGERSPGA
jgi:Double zinc ribbon